MKNLLILVFAITILGCKNNSKNTSETTDDTTIIKGNYIYFEDAAGAFRYSECAQKGHAICLASHSRFSTT